MILGLEKGGGGGGGGEPKLEPVYCDIRPYFVFKCCAYSETPACQVDARFIGQK